MPVDPLSIIGGVGAAAGIIVTITKTVKNLNDLQTKYKEAEMSITQLMRQLLSIKASLQQIQEWTELNLSRSPREQELVEAFGISFEGCKEAMDAMAEEVAKLVQDGINGDMRTMRTRYLWNEDTMKEHQGRLESQVQALQLLLSAVQCHTATEQLELLRNPRSRQIVEKVRDDTVSLRSSTRRPGYARTASIFSHGSSSVGETEFEMDPSIINTEVYRRAMAHQRARSADERLRRPMGSLSPTIPEETTNRLPSPDSGYAEGSEHSGHLSPIDSRSYRRPERPERRQRPRPYNQSVQSEPVIAPRQIVQPHVKITSASETFLPRLNIPVGNKVKKKRSFLPSIQLFTASNTNLSPLSPQDPLRINNHRRGRRHSDTDIHRSIDLHTSDGRSAPPLIQAAQDGSGIEIEELLERGENIEIKHERTRRTALAVASHCGNDDVVAILLSHGASPNAIDANGMTPLHLAATRGHYAVVQYLLKETVQVDTPGPEKKTPLRLAADNGHVEVVDLLLSQRAKVNARDVKNITALHAAAKFGDEDIVNLLLSYKADFEAKDSTFQAAIHHAAENGHERIVDILLNKKSANIEAVGKESMSPLTTACAAGSTDVVRLLLQRKASIKHKGDGAMTPLHWASFNGHSDVVELLLEKRVSIDSRTNDGRTPLHLAAIAENFAVAELLLRKGAAVEAQCQNLFRPLHYAAATSDTGMIQLLLGHGATVEAETNTGKRPLHYATVTGNTGIIELLLQRGASIDARDGAGDRPLCLASTEGHLDTVRLLLNHGAEMRTRYSKGPSHEDSPMCIAAKNGHLAVVEEFVQRGGSVRQRDESNWQPLRYAAYFGHAEIVQYLLACGASISGLDNPGGFGFNLTASRIGFANGIDEYSRQSVLNLLQDAEVREQGSVNPHSFLSRYPSARSPHQDFPAEKGDDYDNGTSSYFAYQPVTERLELPVLQKSPRQAPPPYNPPPADNDGESRQRAEEPPPRAQSPPRPQSPPPRAKSPPNDTSPSIREASRFTLDPSSSSEPKWKPVVPPVPPLPKPSERMVSPLPPHVRSEATFSPRIVSPLPSQSAGPIERPNSPPRPADTPLSPTRPPPPVPSTNRSESNSLYDEPTSPPPPSRSAPLPPDLPPIPSPEEAIIVCDACNDAGKTTTVLTCSGCRKALYMYHHIMSGDTSNSRDIGNSAYETPSVPIQRPAIFELA